MSVLERAQLIAAAVRISHQLGADQAKLLQEALKQESGLSMNRLGTTPPDETAQARCAHLIEALYVSGHAKLATPSAIGPSARGAALIGHINRLSRRLNVDAPWEEAFKQLGKLGRLYTPEWAEWVKEGWGAALFGETWATGVPEHRIHSASVMTQLNRIKIPDQARLSAITLSPDLLNAILWDQGEVTKRRELFWESLRRDLQRRRSGNRWRAYQLPPATRVRQWMATQLVACGHPVPQWAHATGLPELNRALRDQGATPPEDLQSWLSQPLAEHLWAAQRPGQARRALAWRTAPEGLSRAVLLRALPGLQLPHWWSAAPACAETTGQILDELTTGHERRLQTLLDLLTPEQRCGAQGRPKGWTGRWRAEVQRAKTLRYAIYEIQGQHRGASSLSALIQRTEVSSHFSTDPLHAHWHTWKPGEPMPVQGGKR